MKLRPTRHCHTIVLLLSGLGFGVIQAQSQESFGLRGALHSTWAGKDGAPQGIRSLAQAPNGVLWLSAIAGVYTFDGRTFTKFDTPDPNIHNKSFGRIFFTGSGELWMQPLHGALLRVRSGEVRKMDRVDTGEASPKIENVQQAPDGTLWAMLDRHWLVNLGSDDVWSRKAVPASDPKEDLTALHVDQRGGIWIVLGDRLFLRAPGSTKFIPTQAFVYGASSMADVPDGGLWIASSGPPTSAASAHHLQRVNQSGVVLQTRDLRDGLSAAIVGYDSSVWLLTDQSKLIHFRAEDVSTEGIQKTYRLPDVEALGTAVQGDGYNELMRDKDGAVWVGGFGGLERFAMATLHPLVPEATPGLWSHCLVPGGPLWVADPQSRLLLFQERRLVAVMPQKADALFCSAFGVLFRNDDGLWIADKGGNMLLPKPPGLQGYSNHYMFTGAAALPGGAVLATVSGARIGRSLWFYEQGNWQSISLPAGYPEITAMHVLSGRKVLLGLLDGELAVWEEGTVGKSKAMNPGIGSIIGFAEARRGVLAFGASGIALRSGDDARALHFARPELVQRTTGAAEAADGSLWLNAEKGIIRVPQEQWSAAKTDPTHAIEANNIREGNFVGPSEPTLFSDRVQTDSLGNVWFSTLNGIVSINSGESFRDKPPLLVVEDVLGDGRALTGNRTFAPGVSVVDIRYSGIDYRNPLGITYAYKLTGNDADWQNVGARTEAVYTGLRAGRYTFQVRARDAFGTWSAPVSLESFRVEPHVYERIWFRIVCAALAAGLVWAGVQLRLHFAARALRDKAEARADERISIARDLHDTLLQGIQGLLLTLHAAAERVPADHESRKALERALVSTERFVVEGRDRVKGLRSLGMRAGNLEGMLDDVARDNGCRNVFSISTRRSDATLELNEHVESEVFLIAREALLNACKHAQAAHIDIRLSYLEGEFRMSCTDDGHGFERSRLAPSIGNVRFGLQGMEERASALGAQFGIVSEPNRGTQILLTLPSVKAYRRPRA